MTNDYRRDISQSRVDDKVSSLLAAAAAPAESGPLPGEPEALAAFRAHAQTPARRTRMLHSVTPLKAVAASALGTGLLLTGGVAAAATGSLPGAAQDTASRILSPVGVAVPGTADASAGNADERESSEETATTGGKGAGDASERAGDSGKGDHVSELARNPETTGVDKGAEVSGFASGGNSQAGRHGSSGDHADHDGTDISARQKPPVEVPETDGTDAAGDTYSGGSDGAPTVGTAEAGESDGGESADGSENRP